MVNGTADTPPLGPYPPHPRSYLHDELTRITQLIRAYLLRVKSAVACRAWSDDRTLPIEREAALLEEFRWDDPVVDSESAAEHAACVTAADELERQTVERLRRTEDSARVQLTGWELVRRLGLVANLSAVVPRYKDVTRSKAGGEPPPERDSLALDLLLLALLVDRFPAYRKAVAAADGGDESGGLSVETALRILQPTASPAELRWAAFAPTAPLLANELISLRPTAPGGRPIMLIDPRVAAYLLDEDTPPDPSLGSTVTVVHEWRDWERVWLDEEVVAQLRHLSEWWWTGREGVTLVVLLQGPWGTPFQKVVQAFVAREVRSSDGTSRRVAHPILVIDAVAGVQAPNWDGFVRRAYREAVLRRAVVLWTNAEAIQADDASGGRWKTLTRRAEQTGVATFLASQFGCDPADTFRSPRQYFVRVDLPIPSSPVRREIWRGSLHRERNPIAADATPAAKVALDLLESFEFTQGEIEDAVAIARGLALLAPPVEDDRKVPQAADLLAEACRRQAARRPISFAQRLPPRMTPADLAADPKHVLRRRVILPAATGLQLNELLDRMTNLSRVYRDLAFEQRLSLGRGLLVLFTGPPGTGKTLAATTLAGLLRKDLYRVDTAAVASRFVGETEKNLGRLFADVQNANAILFFDEADALFGKRGEVVQAADRWANMQISFLLQRVEEYTGTVILASNARESIDSAFFRRFQVMIDFPRPDSAGRLAILEGMVAGTAVAVADVNGRVATTPEEIRAVLRPVAERFDLTGGNLKNVLLDATFRAVSAAADGTPVLTTRDLILGVAREYQKDGKSVSVATFGKDWFAVVEREMKLARGS